MLINQTFLADVMSGMSRESDGIGCNQDDFYGWNLISGGRWLDGGRFLP